MTQQINANYLDASLSPEARTSDLLGRMTVQEKISQLIQPFGWQMYAKRGEENEVAAGEPSSIVLSEAFKRMVEAGGPGSLYGALRADPWTGVSLATGLSPQEGAAAMNELQRYAIEQSRLGIPVLLGEECSHGHMAIGATVFPVPLALGSTWNPELYRDMCRAVAAETRAQGGAATYSPVLDVVRDPRWGRTEECFGEDPYLIGEFAVAAVEGLQGKRLDAPDAVVATLKHFVGYGSSEGGRNAAPVHMGLRELHDVDLYPFKKAVAAGALSIMPAYHEIDGVPCTTHTYLLRQLLRESWGFAGFIITDCGAIDMLASGHDTADGRADAAAQALKSGIDMEMSGEIFGSSLLEALEQGLITEAHVDEAVGRILRIKFQLGLFERPFVDPELAESVIGCGAHKTLAQRTAEEGIVLLKNDGDLLPLDRQTCGTVAVIGPNADQAYNQLGDYTSPQPRSSIVTVLDGLRERLGGDVLYAPGCRIKDDSRDGFAAALECARKADTIVMVLGGSSARDFGEGTIDLRTGASLVHESGPSDMECGEGIDRTGLGLLGVQLELLQEVYKLGKPVVVVYMNGRPIVEPWIDEHVPAIVEAWYPGQEGGHAIAGILLGEVNPSGRLTVTIPKSVGQLPLVYNGKRTRGKRYLEMDLKPRYPFGYGLSYSRFAYEALTLSRSSISLAELTGGAVVDIGVEIANLSAVDGFETVQLYVTDAVSSVARPAIELKGFQKVFVPAGERRRVALQLTYEQLGFTGLDHTFKVEPGQFRLRVARHALDEHALAASIEVTEGEWTAWSE
jgi:beta-glucosidase